jgi:predicted DNA-binding transcriptional regulator AlpA
MPLLQAVGLTTQEPLMSTVHDDPILTRADIMERLQVSRETVRQWMKAGKLPKPDVALSRKTVGWKRSTLVAAGINL